MTTPLWTPTAEQIAAARMTAFQRFVTENWQADVGHYSQLHRWSIDRPQQFWEAVWRFCGVVASRPWDAAVVDFDLLPGARWFPGARLNFAENLLSHRDDRPAIIAWNEGGLRGRLSFGELYEQVARLADALRRWGLKPGDRVAAYMPNIPETVIAMLAATSLGAIWSSCSPDFGLAGISIASAKSSRGFCSPWMGTCMAVEPSKRSSASQVCKAGCHPWSRS